jgi:hypothetical protein
MVEYNGPAAINIETWNIDRFDGNRTMSTRFSGNLYRASAAEDVTGSMSSG